MFKRNIAASEASETNVKRLLFVLGLQKYIFFHNVQIFRYFFLNIIVLQILIF
jgi:hypothetical protein